jgi:transmembrane sensor
LTTAFSDQVLREASAWYARLQGGDATAEDHARLDDWLAAQPGNPEAYAFVTETGQLAARVQPATNFHRVPAPARRTRRGGDFPVRSRAARRQWAIAGAAAAAIVAAIGVAILSRPHVDTYETAIGEIRNVDLADGSTLVLNGATQLAVTFSRDARDIDIETGEVFVTVGKDPARPFRVHAGGRVIEDIGTAFDVDMNGAQVDVSVGDGTVMISSPVRAGEPAVVVNRGEALTFTTDRLIGRTRTLSALNVGTWRVGVLTYDQTSLAWLVADLNRRFDGVIAVPDPALAAMPVTLTLKLHDRDTTVGTLEKLLPVRAVARPDGSIELVAAKS